MKATRTTPPAENSAPRTGSRDFVMMVALDLVLPLALFYGLRMAGANQWLALVLAAMAPLLRLTVSVVRARRLERAALFTLTMLAIGTAVGLATEDPRLLLARESYITGLVGLWILGSLLASRPLLFHATLQFIPARTAAVWQQNWSENPLFRKTWQVMTAAWGIAFLLDAAVRVVMAYTLPVDLVPVLSTALLLLMLVTIVQASKAYARRHLGTIAYEGHDHQ
jgi:intracellular septation protein A